MHGHMSVSSTEGQGSCFSFELPLQSATGSTDLQAQVLIENTSQPPLAEDLATEIAALRVLLVDDHPINRLMAHNQLNHIGCWVEEAHNGLQALEKLLAQPFDVVLMDIQMPEMDGLQATRELRRLNLDLQPVVVAMTANAYNEDRTACLAAGMEYFLAKPVTLHALRVALNKIAVRYRD
jgi:CheY-like chemotaxis protein